MGKLTVAPPAVPPQAVAAAQARSGVTFPPQGSLLLGRFVVWIPEEPIHNMNDLLCF